MKKLLSIVLVLTMLLPLTTSALYAQSSDFPSAGNSQATGRVAPQSNVYIVIMTNEPAIAYDGGVPGYAPTKPGKGGKINPNSAHVKKYEKFLESTHDATLEAIGASPQTTLHHYTTAANGFAVQLTTGQVSELAKQPGVVKIMPDEMRYPETDSSPTFLGLTGPGGMWLKGYDGEGVVVGIIDSGIWPEHPSFADDGSYGPSPVILEDTPANPACNFGNTAHNPADTPFTCNNKLIGARQMLATYRTLIGADAAEYDSARDDDGHGTHTASTAAGNADVAASMYGKPLGTVSGIAPRARIIAYKGLGTLGGFTSDLAASIDQAVADGVDVINYSIGGGAGGPGADEIAFLFAADAGVHVATSAGNSGPAPATLGNPGTMPWMTTVGASTQSRFFQATATLGDGSRYSGASVTAGTERLPLVDAASAGGDLCIPGTLDATTVAGKIVLCRRGAIGRAAKSQAVFMAGGAGMIMYNNEDSDNLFTDTHWVPSVHIDNTPGVAIKAYIANAASPTAQITSGEISEWPNAPSMTIFSSRGPNPVVSDIIKPDVTAPGLQILAGNSPTPIDGYPGELFQAIAGTSMSSPHVAGLLALIDQAHPDWTPAMAKSALMTTAYQNVRDNDRSSMADPFDMGAGHVDPGGKVGKGSVLEPGLAYDAGLFEYAAFTCGAQFGVFTPGTCDFLSSRGVPIDPSDLNVPSIGVGELPGSQTVIRTVTSVAKDSGWREYVVEVDAPPGYNVTVEPATLRLKRGQTATYAVTFANSSAPIGEWRFGSITWKDKTGLYEVYSPLAVRGTLFDAPAAATGSGIDGSLSFDVKFGYTGSYSAAPHGLIPATVTNDTVMQDPDQTFNPNDGLSNLHQFALTDAALFRIAMPPSATEASADLDIFVFDPSGTQVASSTSGGTDELVDIVLPANGTWSVYVHGWSAPGGDSVYDLFTWAIPLASGGSLSVDAAPTAAVIGTTGTIDVSWSGLSSEWYLGAVSHTGDSGLMGLTLIEVDNTLATGSNAANSNGVRAAGTDGTEDEEELNEKIYLPIIE